jgi:hypothetical protein
MTSALRSIWAVLMLLFVILIPIQFYLAGHGAMEGAHAASKSIVGMKTAWDPHSALGDIMLLLSLLCLLAALAARLPGRLLQMAGGLFVFMIIQLVLAQLNGSASTRWLAAVHGVTALVVTGLAVSLVIRSRPYWPIAASNTTA